MLPTQPPDATCEAILAADDLPPNATDTNCPNAAEFLVEFAGFSCADCLATMVEFGTTLAVDSADPPDEVVRVRLYEPGQPLFSATAPAT